MMLYRPIILIFQKKKNDKIDQNCRRFSKIVHRRENELLLNQSALQNNPMKSVNQT